MNERNWNKLTDFYFVCKKKVETAESRKKLADFQSIYNLLLNK